MKLETTGSKKDLIDRLLALNTPQQESVVVPQAIPLRSRDERSRPIEAATRAMKDWRRLIFQGRNNIREFTLVNNNGEPYTLKMKYAKCSPTTLSTILEHKWYLPLPKYRDIVELINKNPDQFNITIVQKPSMTGNNWLMLHVEPKAG